MKREDDDDRELNSLDALPEMIKDYEDTIQKIYKKLCYI